MKIRLLFILLAVLTAGTNAEIRIGQIFINRDDVFDSTQSDWFFAAPLANSLHSVTKSYIVEDELLFTEGDFLNFDLISETERNLRSTGFFTNVSIVTDTINSILTNVIINTQERWSTNPSILIGTGENSVTLGGRLEEINFLGMGTRFSIEALRRTENNTGMQGAAELGQRRLFRSELNFYGRIMANKFRTEQNLSLSKPFRTLDTKWSFGITGNNSFGREFLFHNIPPEPIPFHGRNLDLWFSRAWHQGDRVFVTGMLKLDDVNRGSRQFERAYDNTGKILLSFSSVAEDFYKTTKINSYQTEDLSVGGWGTAILGKTFAMGSKGESLYYIAAQGEKSYLTGNLYLFGQMTAASAFMSSSGRYTYQEFSGTGFYRLSESFVLATRIRQMTVWNWYKQRQLILDNNSGLRGYSLNSIQGDNRLVGNFEFRMFPDIKVWIVNCGAVAFCDFGTAWNQQTYLSKTRWHSSVGLGFRLQNMKDVGPNAMFRIDFAYNMDERKFGEIIFTTDQLFSAFRRHTFKLPEMYGTEFDYE